MRVMKQQVRWLALFLVFVISATLPAYAAREIRSLGVAPLLGEFPSVGRAAITPTRESVMEQANRYPERIRAAVRQAGHNAEMAEAVLQVLQRGEVQETSIASGTVLKTMGWYGRDNTGRWGVYTLYDVQLETARAEPAWGFRTTVGDKTVVWVLLKQCGNLCKWAVETTPQMQPRPSVRVEVTPPEAQLVAIAPERKHGPIDTGDYNYLGSTSSSFSVGLSFRPPDVKVTQNGGGADVRVCNNISNVNQNNNSSTSQAQNVTPVNVVVNTGSGDANGSASGNGGQGSNTGQGNLNF